VDRTNRCVLDSFYMYVVSMRSVSFLLFSNFVVHIHVYSLLRIHSELTVRGYDKEELCPRIVYHVRL